MKTKPIRLSAAPIPIPRIRPIFLAKGMQPSGATLQSHLLQIWEKILFFRDVANGEESYEDYGAAEEQEPEIFNPFGDPKKSLRF
jgi:hypothetical protein